MPVHMLRSRGGRSDYGLPILDCRHSLERAISVVGRQKHKNEEEDTLQLKLNESRGVR